MATRIYSCGKDFKNLKICIERRVIGFRHMFSADIQDDVVYLVVSQNDDLGSISHCYARAIISYPTGDTPPNWNNAKKYILCHKIKDVEFCKPFSLRVLNNAKEPNWHIKYAQDPKAIKDDELLSILDNEFNKNISKDFYVNVESEEDDENHDESLQTEDVMGNGDLSPIEISSTFKIDRFTNETDKNRGLEYLVNKNFFKLFSDFQEKNSILIPKNAIFSTKAKNKGYGVNGRPDALLITYDKDNDDSYIKINIIEYECYGEGKVTYINKMNHLNSKVIPQLIRFTSAFSTLTDALTRNNTIDSWIKKIVGYIEKDNELVEKIDCWFREINHGKIISHSLVEELLNAFKKNIRIMLIIDELTGEQEETLKNIINSIKLPGNSADREYVIDFKGYVVRLEYMLNHDDNSTSKYALSIQDN